jgi:CRISPR/Cas system CSM-associated protein Csm3 (group 7 of RAMP superfamily)
MHKQIVNELRLVFVIEPRGPILIKSGREAGADPTLLDMNFVRLDHAALGRSTVYLPGSSLKGTVRSYCEKIARTVADGIQHDPPFSCNPLGNSDRKGRDDYSCGRWFERRDQRGVGTDQKHAGSCAICRIFGHTSLAAHLRFSDAYPLDPANLDDLTVFESANTTEQRDGVAIDRISGAVAVGPFNLEVVTKGAFFGDLVIRNFQLWQVGLLAIALRDLARERVPIGFSKSRGLGRVSLHYRELEIAYPGCFRPNSGDRDLARHIYGVSAFLKPEVTQSYGYKPETPLPLRNGSDLVESGDYGRVAVAFHQAEAIEAVLRDCVESWRAFVEDWRSQGGV